MRPIAVIAIAILAAFFMPWVSFGDPKERTEVRISVTGLDIARGFGEANKFISEMSKNKDKDKDKDKDKGGPDINIAIWVWALPGLALLTILTTGKGLLGRLMGFLTGGYVFGWITYGILKIPDSERSKALKDIGDHIFDFLGVGAYVVLIGSLLLVIFGLAGVGASSKDSD